jgi:hypothetical protein
MPGSKKSSHHAEEEGREGGGGGISVYVFVFADDSSVVAAPLIGFDSAFY